jgi:endonuclease-8
VIGTDAAVALGIDLAKLALWRTRDEPTKLGWLGPDLLSPEPDLEEAARRIRLEPERPLTAALLDQGNVAGLGNEYVTELLFLRGIRPDRRVRDTGDLDELLAHARDLMLENRDRIERTFTGNPRPGQRSYVFGRAGHACRRCGTVILEGTHASGQRDGGTRRSAWCPRCQAS